MDNSTAGVTLMTGFVFDVLKEFESMKTVAAPAFAMARGLNPSKPDDWCEMSLYNDVCDWIEKNIGASSVRKAGRAIGERAYANIVAQGKMHEPTPNAIMKALQWAASVMIRDPKKRGWEILEEHKTSLVMRRTQTFHCILQEGLLLALVEKTGVLMPAVEHSKCTRRGDAFCDYKLTWLPKKK